MTRIVSRGMPLDVLVGLISSFDAGVRLLRHQLRGTTMGLATTDLTRAVQA
jgi:hypothetical protein